MNNKFKDRVKELRLEKKLTQKELGIALGFGRTTLNEWERRGAEPSFDTLIKIATYFDVSIDYLLGYKDYE